MKKSFTYLLVSLFIVFISCEKTPAKKIESYFREKHNYSFSNNLKAIFVLTESGCMNCNKQFSEFISKDVAKDDVVCLIKASGTRVDISGIENNGITSFYDTNPDEAILSESGVIFLKNKEIDTIIKIDAKTLDGSFSYIKQKLTK